MVTLPCQISCAQIVEDVCQRPACTDKVKRVCGQVGAPKGTRVCRSKPRSCGGLASDQRANSPGQIPGQGPRTGLCAQVWRLGRLAIDHGFTGYGKWPRSHVPWRIQIGVLRFRVAPGVASLLRPAEGRAHASVGFASRQSTAPMHELGLGAGENFMDCGSSSRQPLVGPPRARAGFQHSVRSRARYSPQALDVGLVD